MAKKPSTMKRTGKATTKKEVAKKKNTYAKAMKAASKLGGGSGKVVTAIGKRKAARAKLLKSL